MSEQSTNNMNREELLADPADGTLSGPEWDAWLLANPDAAADLAITRRTRALMADLRAASVQLPADFEVCLMRLVRSDTTLLDLIDLWLSGLGHALVELVNLLLASIPAPPPVAPVPETESRFINRTCRIACDLHYPL